MNLSNELSQQVTAHIDEVRKYLGTLPADERQEILQSIESHIYDALQNRSDGEPTSSLLEAVLAEMDPPESYGELPSAKRPKSAMKPLVSVAVVLTTILGIWVTFGIRQNPAHMITAPESEHPPVVVNTFPLGGNNAVDPNITELRVTFNKDMLTDRMWSWCTESQDTAPKFTSGGTKFIDKRTCVTPVDLEPNKTYVVWINTQKNDAFRDIYHNPAVPYRLEFKTGNEQPLVDSEPDPTGRWISIDFVSSVEKFDPKTKASNRDLYLKELTFLPDGKTDRPFWTWKNNVLHHSGDNTDAELLIKEMSGEKYLFMEWMSGDVIELGLPPKYYVFKKVHATPSQ